MFITFEGPDGSGKTTALNTLVKELQKLKLDFILTREPGEFNSAVNKKIRQIIVDNDSDITPMVEVMLFSADRRLHLEKLIWPALKQNKIVISDRYIDSTFAYQGEGRGLGLEKMIDFQDIVTDKTYPDFTFYFDLSIEESRERVKTRGKGNRIDNEGEDFVKRVHDGYSKLIKMFPERYIVINASKNPDEVFEQVLSKFNEKVFHKIT